MHISAIKTPIVHSHDSLFEILHQSLPTIPEQSVIVITSKIIALCEGEVANVDDYPDKHQLVREYAEKFIDPHSSKYNVMLTIKNHVLAVNAGIDESNTDAGYVLWPKDPQATANQIWQWIRQEYGVKQVGVIISDSKTFPLKWGVIGTALAHCGFSALVDKRHTPDLFGRELKITQVNVMEALAVSGVFAMGEANEQTPVALIKDIPHIEFVEHEPTPEELESLVNIMEDDVYAPILQSADWKKGGGSI